MSDNLNRSTPDFSKYDSMSIGELEEILRTDAMGPERDDSDVDEILYVMEVLAKKRRQNGIAGKTALEAYQEFQQHYLPMAEEESSPKRKATIIPFRRIAAVAASLVLVFTLTTSVNAFGWKDLWDAVIMWAEETFTFSTNVEVSQPKTDDFNAYASIIDALETNGRNSNIVPTWIPEGYELVDLIIDKNPMQETYLAIYSKDDSRLKVSVQSFISIRPEHFEASDEYDELYTVSGIDCFIISNYNTVRAAWMIDSYECNISGEIGLDDLKHMLDSIPKG